VCSGGHPGRRKGRHLIPPGRRRHIASAFPDHMPFPPGAMPVSTAGKMRKMPAAMVNTYEAGCERERLTLAMNGDARLSFGRRALNLLLELGVGHTSLGLRVSRFRAF